MGSSTEHATLIVTDDAGRQLGYINGNLVNQIPGARVNQVISSGDWTDNIAPDFFLPADVKYTISLDGTSLSSPDNETLAITGPSYDLSVGPIPIRPGDKDTLVVEPDATQLSYTSSRKESPALTLGVSDNRADYSFQIAGISDQPGSTLNLGLPPEGGNLNLQYVGAAAHVEREPQDDPVQPARRAGLRPQRHPSGRRRHRPTPIRQLDQYQPGHPPGRHPRRPTIHPDPRRPVARLAWANFSWSERRWKRVLGQLAIPALGAHHPRPGGLPLPDRVPWLSRDDVHVRGSLVPTDRGARVTHSGPSVVPTPLAGLPTPKLTDLSPGESRSTPGPVIRRFVW